MRHNLSKPGLCGIVVTVLLTVPWVIRGIGTPTPKAETKVNQQPEMLVKDSSGGEVELYSRSDAILIGNGNYTDSVDWHPLRNVPTQLAALRIALEAHGFHVVVYEDLTSRDMVDALDSFVRHYGYDHEARLVFYYAGHGATRDDKEGDSTRSVGYVVPVDAPKAPSDTSTISEIKAFLDKAIRLTQFLEWAEAMEARHVLFIFDSCFSGAILGQRGKSDEERRPKPSPYIYSAKARSPVRWFLTAGTAGQTVPAEDRFTDLLIQALSGTRRDADQNHDGFLTTGELVNYLENTVPYYNDSQTPQDGKIRDPLLDIGDMVFQLPSVGKDEIAGRVYKERISGKLFAQGTTLKISEASAWDEFKGLFPEAQVFLKAAGKGGGASTVAHERELHSIVSGLESNKQRELLDARNQLTQLLPTAGPNFVSEVINGIPQGSYNYQLGVGLALACTPGWLSSDPPLSKRVLETAQANASDPTLKLIMGTALKASNM